MEITKSLLQQCEDLIAKGNISEVLENLRAMKDQTGYKNDILNLSSRWKKFSRDRMSGTLSSEDETLQNTKLNNDALLLLDALQRELSGEKVEVELFHRYTADQRGTPWRPLTQTYLPILLTALAVWGIAYFAYQPTPVECDQPLNLSGPWEVFSNFSGTKNKVGNAKISQNKCSNFFQLSGALRSPTNPNRDAEFSTKVGGFNDGEIIFVYENFSGEIGICRGIVPTSNTNEFEVHCVDLIGFNKDGSTGGTLKFEKIETK